MDSRGLHDAIRIVAETANFDPLFDYFADDVELRVSVALQSQARDERRGRQSVIRHLQRLYSADSPASEEPVDLSSSGRRIVACRIASFAIGGGLTIRDDCALVFDIGDGLIRHLAINHELSTLLDAGTGVLSIARPHEGGRIDGTVAETIQS
jgi:hypothetical protein